MTKKIPNNAFPTEEQFKMRELFNQLASEEVPLSADQLTKLAPLVERVRYEIKEIVSEAAVYDSDGRLVKEAIAGKITRVDYFRLNERGLKLKHKWERGLLDSLLD